MGSLVELNDTLRISKAQGFPDGLDISTHLKTPYNIKDFEGKVFAFHSKPKIRNYQQMPVRNFLVEEIDGKWVYWGLCHITEITHNYEIQQTAGKFKIIYINSPEEMKKAFELIDRRPELNYFG